MELPGRTFEIADALNDVLSKRWRELRGLEIVSFGINSIKANEEDEAKIQKVQMSKTFADPSMAMGAMADSTSDSMRMAAQNEGGGGAAFGFMNMNMAGNAGAGLYQQMAQQQEFMRRQKELDEMTRRQEMMDRQKLMDKPARAEVAQAAEGSAAGGWTCPQCGTVNQGKFCPGCGAKKPEPKPAEGAWTCQCGQTGNTGKFCMNCGKPKPEQKEEKGWVCPGCGAVNQGKFCMECGSPKPAGALLFKCDKCGWQPEDPHHPPKFCPRCGDPFDDKDKQ